MSNINPDTIAANFAKQYSTDGHGDNYSRAQFSGLTLGVVVDTDDPMQMGRLRIFCPSLNDSPKKPQLLPWAAYITPFGGSINNSEYYRGAEETNATSSGSLHYGFWGIPEMGAQVLVGCVDGDPRRRFWIGCVPEHQQTHTIHNGRWKWANGAVDGPLTGDGSPMQPAYSHANTAFDGRNDSPEWRSRIADYQTTAVSEDIGQLPNSKQSAALDQQNAQITANDPDTWERATLGSQGYDWSGFKKLDYKSSRVVGLSTPGMHSLVMDDRPFNSRIRMKTTAGHQILLDDTNERIYIATYDGENWVELDRNGNIDMFSSNRISIHAAKDLNLNAGQTIRMFAGEGIHGYCGSDMVTQDVFDYENPTGVLRQDPLEQAPQPGEIRFHATADLHLKSEQNIRQLSLVDTFMEANGNFWGKVDKSYYLQVATDININTDTGDWNLTTANNINETTKGHAKRFSYGTSAIAANGRVELFSFESTTDIGAQQGLNMKSSNGNVMLEAQGNGGGKGGIQIRTPASQLEVGDDGIGARTDKSVRVKSSENQEFEITPSGPKLSSPVSIDGIPDIDAGGMSCGAPTTPLPWNGSRTKITPDEAAQVCYNAGFRGKDLVIAVATCMGESSLRTSVLNPAAPTGEKWGDVVGLFQIRTLKNPDAYTGIDRLRDNRNRQLENPNENARVGYKIFSEAAPAGQWTVGKWESFGGKHGGELITRNLAAASAAVNKLCGNPVPAARIAALTAESFKIGYVVDDEVVPAEPMMLMAQTAEEESMSLMASFGPVGGAVTAAQGTLMQLSKTTGAKLQSMVDIEMKSISNGLQTKYSNLVNQVNTSIASLDQLSYFMGYIMPLIKIGLAAVSNPFTLEIPFEFDIPGLVQGMFDNMMPPQLKALAGSLGDLNALAQSIPGGLPGVAMPIDMFNIYDSLNGNAAALSALGLPTDLNFPINPGMFMNIPILDNIITQIKTLDVPVLQLPTFDDLVDRIFSNNSIPMKLDLSNLGL